MARTSVSVLTAIKLHIPKNTGLLVAVSGGKDSVVLLDGLLKMQRLLKIRIEVAHVDHGLRISSPEDAEFVRQLALSNELPFHLRKLVPPNVPTNIENWGRKERYAFLRSVAQDRGLDLILTAHHCNDVAETFLMRLVSNKELRSIHAKNKNILRPLLNVSRREIEKHLKKYSLQYKEDHTNTDQRFLRNKVRLALIPEFEKQFHPRIAQWIAERAKALDSDSRCLDRLAKQQLNLLAGREFGAAEWQVALTNQASAIGLRMIEFAFLSQIGFRLGRQRSRLVKQVILGKKKSCDLPCGWSLAWSDKRLKLKNPST